MYTQFNMVRMQIYLEDDTRRDLGMLAKQEKRPVAKVMRDILREGIARRKKSDTSGVKTLLALTEIGATSDDRRLSEHIDHYLYGAPKKG